MADNVIFVLSSGRTGSTLVCELLTHYQHTVNIKEVLYYTHTLFSDYNNTLFSVEERTFFKHLYNKYNNTTLTPREVITTAQEYFKKTIILKIHLHQFDQWSTQELDWILSQPNHRFILLERINFLEVAVSDTIAKQTNVWHISDTSDIKIKIDPVVLIQDREIYQNNYTDIKNRLAALSIDYQYIEYDRDLKIQNAEYFVSLVDPWIKRIGLNLEQGSVPALYVRRQNNNHNVLDNIINREEIENLVKNNYQITTIKL